MLEQPDDLKRVLVIAEDARTRSSMVALFEGEGYVVQAAQDSVEALTLVDQYAPQVIVLRVAVPVTLGLDMLQSLRSRRPPLVLPAVLMAADATVIVDAVSEGPRILSDQPMPLEQVLLHVDQLALPD
jgi:CheY-like chemotaxis protein